MKESMQQVKAKSRAAGGPLLEAPQRSERLGGALETSHLFRTQMCAFECNCWCIESKLFGVTLLFLVFQTGLETSKLC